LFNKGSAKGLFNLFSLMNGVAIIIELSNPAFLLSFQFLLIHSLKGQFGNCNQLKDQNPSIRLLSVLPLPTQHLDRILLFFKSSIR